MTILPRMATKDRVIDAVLVVTCGVVQAAALAIAAFATRDAFAALHEGRGLADETILALAMSGIVAAACLFFSRRRAEALGQSYANSLRQALYAQIAKLPKSRHEERRVGALSLRFVGDLSAARLWFGRGLPEALSAMVVLPSAIAILFALEPNLARIGLIPLAVAVITICLLAWHLERRHRQLRQRRASIAISMIERIAIAPELDLMGRTEKELRALEARGVSLRNLAIKRRGRTAALQAILQAGVALSGLTLLWFASLNGLPPSTVAASLSVLALIALPMQEMTVAWDQYCAWRVARDKARKLMSAGAVSRVSQKERAPVSVEMAGVIDGKPVSFRAPSGRETRLEGPNALIMARCISGLDEHDSLKITFGDLSTRHPRIAHIDTAHIGLQGSLRRSATMMCGKRPSDERIAHVLAEFGLGELLDRPMALDQRVHEGGKGLTMAQTLRIDLARAVLGKANLIVVSSLRWETDRNQSGLLNTLRSFSSATVIVADVHNGYCTSKAL